jgi:chromosome segregation ATPase
MVAHTKLEIQEEELTELKGQCLKREKELSRFKRHLHECQDYIDSFKVQINFKIVELDIEKEELQRVITKITHLENTIQMLERDNEALASSNGVIITDKALFHDKIRQMTR